MLPQDMIGPGPCIVAAIGTVFVLCMMVGSWIRGRFSRAARPPKDHIRDLLP